jgi:ferrous-iron efflux pump FieF
MVATSPAQVLTRRRLPLIAFAVSACLVVIKGVGAAATGSLALGSAAVDSLVDLLVSGLNALVVRRSAAPPDADHAYGHGKFENLAALAQACLLLAATVGLVVAGVRRLRSGAALTNTGPGIVIFVVALLISLFLSRYLRRGAAELESPALQADSVHYFSDFVVNASGLVALLVVRWTGWLPADSLVAFGVAVFVLAAALRILRDAVGDLADRGLPEIEIRRIEAVIATFPEVVGVHDLKTRRSGGQRFIEFHLEIPSVTSFPAAHDLAVRVLRAVECEFPHSKVFVHGDPV